MAQRRNPTVVGGIWGLVWGTLFGVALRETGLAAIPVGMLFGVAVGIAMRLRIHMVTDTESEFFPEKHCDYTKMVVSQAEDLRVPPAAPSRRC